VGLHGANIKNSEDGHLALEPVTDGMINFKSDSDTRREISDSDLDSQSEDGMSGLRISFVR
jgi:hypothetical protein